MGGSTVSLCMIVRDESENLLQCLACVADLVDEMIIVDTGSVDGTADLARRCGAKVLEFPWIDDFSAARNFGLRHARGDWIFWLDADDRIDEPNRQRLRHLFKQLDSLPPDAVTLMTCQSQCALSDGVVQISQTRLFPNHRGFCFTRRIHEQVIRRGESAAAPLLASDVVIQHLGYADAKHQQLKLRRDERILMQELADNANDAQSLFYLGRMRLGQKRLEEALTLLQRSIAADPARTLTTTLAAYPLAASCLNDLRRPEEALAVNERGLLGAPTDPALLYQRAAFLHEQGQLTAAVACLSRLLSLADAQSPLSIAGLPPGVFTHKPRTLLARIYALQGDRPRAEEQFRLALADCPQCGEALYFLGQLLLAEGRLAEMPLLLRQLQACPNADYNAQLLGAMTHVARREFPEAQALLDQAQARYPAAVGPLLVRCDLYWRRGDRDRACLDAHERLLALDPRHPEAAARLRLLRAMLNPPQPVYAM